MFRFEMMVLNIFMHEEQFQCCILLLIDHEPLPEGQLAPVASSNGLSRGLHVL